MDNTPDPSFKIIIIEDDFDISQLIAYNLHKEGFSTELAFDGLEAQKKLREEKFDIVILDIMLPDIDGFDICREIKGSDNGVSTFVIIISARSNAQDKLYAHILGADCYITKPFSVKVLVDAVKEIFAIQNREFVVKTK